MRVRFAKSYFSFVSSVSESPFFAAAILLPTFTKLKLLPSQMTSFSLFAAMP